MLREIADLGFTHAELSHGIRILLVPGVLRALEEGFIKIASTHNFCPLPPGVTQAAPNLFQPSVRDEREHGQWVRHTKRSIDFAAQVKARVCVLHLGSARFWFFPPSRKLHAYLEKNPEAKVGQDAKYQAMLRKACATMRSRSVPFWKQTIESMKKIQAYAAERGVALGCENREKFEELPIDDDFGALFEALGEGSPCGYWHDTGHAEIKAGMGVIDHRLQLEKNAERLLGFHLHDVSELDKDHQAVGAGRVDFEMVSSFWRPHHLLTLELGPRVRPEEIVSSRERIESLMARRFG